MKKLMKKFNDFMFNDSVAIDEEWIEKIAIVTTICGFLSVILWVCM